MHVVDPEIQSTEEVRQRIVGINPCSRAWVEESFRVQRFREVYHSIDRVRCNIQRRAGRARAATKKRTRGEAAALLPFGSDEEVKPVLDDWAAQRKAVLLEADGDVAVVDGAHLLVAEDVGRAAAELVRAGLRDGIEQHSREICLAHISGRQENTEFFHRAGRDKATAARTARQSLRAPQVESVVLIRAVDREVVVSIVLAARADAAAIRRGRGRAVLLARARYLRCELGEIGEASIQEGNAAD